MATVFGAMRRLAVSSQTSLRSLNRSSLSSACFYSTEDIQSKLDKLVKDKKVVVFMKGVPEQPMCGFSNAVVQILRMHGVEYDAHNVLADEQIRQGIKEYSNWPTIPQIFIDGNFVGGCDIMLQMHRSGELIEELQKVGIRSALLDTAEDEPSSSDKK